MTDLHTRFRTLDDLPAPDLWPEVEAKASAAERPGVRSLPWLLIAATLLLTVSLSGSVLDRRPEFGADLDSHDEHGRGPPLAHGYAAARWQGARRGGQRLPPRRRRL